MRPSASKCITSLWLLPNIESYIFHNIFHTKNRKCKIFRRLTREANETFLKNIMKILENKFQILFWRVWSELPLVEVHQQQVLGHSPFLSLWGFFKFTLKSRYIWGQKWYIDFEIQKVHPVPFKKFQMIWASETLVENIYVRHNAKCNVSKNATFNIDFIGNK